MIYTNPKISLPKNKIWYSKQVNNLQELAAILQVEELTPSNTEMVVQTDNTGKFLRIKGGELAVTLRKGQTGINFGGE